MDILLEKQPVEQTYHYAGFWIRFAASLLDGIILAIPMCIIVFGVFFVSIGSTFGMEALSNPNTMENTLTAQQTGVVLVTMLLLFLISIVIPIFYYAGMHSSKWQATIGKKLLRLKVTDMEGNRISFWRALGRYLAMAFLSGIFYVGYIIAAFTDKKQSLHDLIASTVVIKED